MRAPYLAFGLFLWPLVVSADVAVHGPAAMHGRTHSTSDPIVVPTATPTVTPFPTGMPTFTPTNTPLPTSTPTPTPTVASGSNRINPGSDLTYLGAFRVPTGDSTTWQYASMGLEFNPDGNGGAGSLFVEGFCCSNGTGKYAEISIPAPVVTSTVSSLNRATLLQSFADIAPGLHTEAQTGYAMGDVLYGPSVGISSKLVWNRWIYYLPNQENLLGCASTTLATPATEGPWHIGPTPLPTPAPQPTPGFGGATLGRYLVTIPSAWATAHTGGRRLGTGRFRDNSNGGGVSWGPSLYAVSAGCNSTAAADAIEIFRKYDSINLLWAHMSWGDDWPGAAWIEGPGNKAAFVVSGMKSEREFGGTACGFSHCGNGNGTDYYGLPQPHDCGSHGVHAAPQFGALLFYDVNTLAQAADGLIAHNVPEPYAVFQFQSHQFNALQCTANKGQLGGIAYDSTNNKIYVAETHGDGTSPVFHVFQVSDGGGANDTTAPAVPTNLHTTSVTSSSVALAWDASADADAATVYIVYRNPIDQVLQGTEVAPPYGYLYPAGLQPIAITTGTTWTESLEVASGRSYTFWVAARDAVGNTSARTAGLGVTTP